MSTMVIPREARRITYSTKIREMKNIPLSNLQKAVVAGSILGDGCLCENWSKTNYRLKMSHSVKQREYILWKYGMLKNFVLSEPKANQPTKSVSFRTISHPEFTELRSTFYRGKQKIIPRNIEELLKDPIAIAIWFMDDGNIVKRNGKTIGFHLNTQSFTKTENEYLKKMFLEKYEICVNIENNKRKYRLAIWRQLSRARFVSLIERYTIPSMQYKLS